KTGEAAHFGDAIKGNPGETVLALAGVAGICGALSDTSTYAGPMTAALLIWPTLAFAAAPVNSWAARRAALPPELAQRRRTEFARARRARRVSTVGRLALAIGAVAAVVALLLP